MISPYVRRLRLAAELRALRTHAGVTHVQLAKQIGQSRRRSLGWRTATSSTRTT